MRALYSNDNNEISTANHTSEALKFPPPPLPYNEWSAWLIIFAWIFLPPRPSFPCQPPGLAQSNGLLMCRNSVLVKTALGTRRSISDKNKKSLMKERFFSKLLNGYVFDTITGRWLDQPFFIIYYSKFGGTPTFI